MTDNTVHPEIYRLNDMMSLLEDCFVVVAMYFAFRDVLKQFYDDVSCWFCFKVFKIILILANILDFGTLGISSTGQMFNWNFIYSLHKRKG